MKIDVSRNLVNYTGKLMVERNAEGVENPISLRDLCCIALTTPVAAAEVLSGVEKVRRFTLAQRIYSENVLEIPVEDIALIKKLIDSHYNTIVVGAAWTLLESESPMSNGTAHVEEPVS